MISPGLVEESLLRFFFLTVYSHTLSLGLVTAQRGIVSGTAIMELGRI